MQAKADIRFQDSSDYDSVAALIEGVNEGELLVHVRVKDDEGLVDDVIEPMAGELLRSTEMYQTAVEMYGEGPDITCFADDFSWLESDFITEVRHRSPDDLEAVFVEKQACIQRCLGGGRVEDADGNVTSYELSPMGDHESDLFRSEPAGVETSDWYTNQVVDVVAVVDGDALRHALADQHNARAYETPTADVGDHSMSFEM